MASPLISVILPSHNHAGFVAEAVNSVLNQTVRDIELIVVDDGSSDGTPDVVENIHDPRLRLIRLEQNRLKHPRNLGIGLAQGEYIAFQNSDDVWLPEKLELQLGILEKQDDVVACFTGTDIIDRYGNIPTDSWANGIFIDENRPRKQWLKYFFEVGNCLCISSALVRRDALKQTGQFTGSFVQLSDLDLWVRLASIGEFYILQDKLTCFRDTTMGETSENKSGNLSGPNISNHHRSVIEYSKLLENYTREPIIDLLPEIFPNVIPVEPGIRSVRVAQLAKHAWSLNSIQHSLFADHAISQIMDNGLARDEVTKHLGAEIIQEFVKRRGNLDIRFAHELAVLIKEKEQTINTVKEKEQTMNAILESRSWKLTHPLRLISSIWKKFRGSK